MSARLCPIQTCLRIAVATISAAAVLYPAFGTAEEKETLETMLAVWRKREAATKSVKVVIAEDHNMAAETGIEGEAMPGGVSKFKRLVVIAGGNMRHERVGDLWAAGIDKPDEWTWIAVNDGDRDTTLSRVDRDGSMIHSTGRIHGNAKHADVHNIYLAAILCHWRPLSPTIGVFHVDELKLVSADEKLGRERVLLLEQRKDDQISRYWVAPEKEMSMVRHTRTWKDKLTAQLDVEYKHDAKLGWVPSKWKGTTSFESATDTVTELEVNLDVLPATFDIDFPPRTRVYDRINKTSWVVKPEKTPAKSPSMR